MYCLRFSAVISDGLRHQWLLSLCRQSLLEVTFTRQVIAAAGVRRCDSHFVIATETGQDCPSLHLSRCKAVGLSAGGTYWLLYLIKKFGDLQYICRCGSLQGKDLLRKRSPRRRRAQRIPRHGSQPPRHHACVR